MDDSLNVSDAEIKAFVSLFDGDSVLATRAIALYSAKNSRKIPSPLIDKTPRPVLVNIDGLKKTYKIGHQQVCALNDVSLKVYQGEFVALTGASGSGKSTLLQLIGGLDKPTEGVIEVDGVDLCRLKDEQLSKFRNRTIGFVFQFFYLQPFLSVGINLELPGMFSRTKRKQRQNDALKLAMEVGIDDRMRHLPRELSGGQMQRAAIARALLNKPKIILADEPTGNLDSVNGMAIIELFETIRKEFGTTIILVTHDPQIAIRADRIIRLEDGMII